MSQFILNRSRCVPSHPASHADTLSKPRIPSAFSMRPGPSAEDLWALRNWSNLPQNMFISSTLICALCALCGARFAIPEYSSNRTIKTITTKHRNTKTWTALEKLKGKTTKYPLVLLLLRLRDNHSQTQLGLLSYIRLRIQMLAFCLSAITGKLKLRTNAA